MCSKKVVKTIIKMEFWEEILIATLQPDSPDETKSKYTAYSEFLVFEMFCKRLTDQFKKTKKHRTSIRRYF